MITFSFSKLWVLILTVLFISPLAVHAQKTYYVRAGAAGANNGLDWANAYSSLPSTLVRGATYYITDGSYGSYTFNDAVSTTLVITLKKAIESDHGAGTGWSSTYGDGQAVFGDLIFATNYYEINGQVRNENDWHNETAYGFDILYPGNITINAGVSHLKFKYIDLGAANGTAYPNAAGKAINMTFQATPWRTDLYFGYMHIHNVGTAFHSINAGEVTLEYSLLEQTYGKEVIRHENGHNWVIRYCKFLDGGIKSEAEGQTAVIGIFNHSGGDVQSDNWELYGDVFGGTGQFQLLHSNALILASIVNNWKFYHNVISHTDGNWGGAVEIKGGTGNQIRNCIWYWMGDYDESSGSIISTGNASVNNSWVYYKNTKPARIGNDGSNLPGTVYFGTEDPFVNEAGLDYRLKASFAGVSPIGKAVNLGAPYNVDANGVSHSNIGAFATAGQQGAVTTAPTITTQPLNATVTIGQTATFSVTATGSTPLFYQWRRDGANITGATGTAYTTPAAISSDNGATFRVAVSNSAGSVTSSAATLTVSTLANAAPAVQITGPLNGASFTAPANVTIQAGASDSDGAISKVEFFNGGTKLGEDGSSPYAYTWSGVNAGSYSLTARATDNLGTVATSSAISITVNPPTSTSGTFSVGDQVGVIVSPSLRVRSSPLLAGTILGIQPQGAVGTVVGGPITADGYTWWQIDYDNSPDGWSIEGVSGGPFLILAPSAPTGLRIVQ